VESCEVSGWFLRRAWQLKAILDHGFARRVNAGKCRAKAQTNAKRAKTCADRTKCNLAARTVFARFSRG